MIKWLPLLCIACDGVDQSYFPVPRLDEAVFVADVEPVLEARCANPSCHGRPERPLSIFAPHFYREDSTRTFLNEALSDDELRHNYDLSCSFAVGIDFPDDCLLLRKPLGLAYHGGGVVLDETDPEARAIRDWLWFAEY